LRLWANLAAEHFRDNLNHGSRVNQHDINRLYQEARFAHKRKSQEALDVGTAVHSYAEQYSRYHTEGGPEPDMPMEEEALNGVLAFLDFVRKHKVLFHKSEVQLYNWQFHLAGTCDTIFTCDGKLYIGDFKTSKAIYPEYHYQVSFYRFAYEKLYHPVDSAAIIRFDKATGEFEFVELDEEHYLTNLLAVHGARELHYAIKGF
jgi:ATP-dependent exoDNAse (exonuclease V) beta subunit